jgi:putative aldouronate transport system permease protein
MKRKNNFISDIVISCILAVVALATLFPFINTLAVSLNKAYDTSLGGVYLYPRVFTLENYLIILQHPDLKQGFIITIARTILGAGAALICTAMFAYGLSKPNLKGKKVYMGLSIFTMYFGGGLIPYYLLLRQINLIDNFLVYVIPNLIGIFNMIIMRTYFKSLPEALEESAKMDGAGTFTVFFKIVIPLSAPILATIALFNGVFQWNSWFDANLFINNPDLKPLQMVLVKIINSTRIDTALAEAGAGAQSLAAQKVVNIRSVTASTIMITIIPIIMIYPFLQRFFVKGIMIGAVKG